MTNSLTHTVAEIAHGIAKAAHHLIQNPVEKAADILKEKGIKEVCTTTWNSHEGRVIVAKGSGEFYNVEHDPQLRRSLLNIVLFSDGEKNGEERLSQAMDTESTCKILEKVTIPKTKAHNPKVRQLFPITSKE